MKRAFLAAAALVAAVAVFVGFTIQPRRLALTPQDDGTVAGVLHIHTSRSDGLSGPDEIAAAAARAGLKFIVFTDHGDATRRADPPAYRSGVLCLDAVEISTTGGHYVALDMAVAPYPLGGEARAVVEDVHRLGGFGIAAHPDSPKLELRWQDWTLPFDAIEVVNPDTSWREWAAQVPSRALGWSERGFAARRLAAALVDYRFRPAETMAGLLNDPSDLTTRWVALTGRRRVVTLAGADAHAKLALRSADPDDSRLVLQLPSYESSFRTLSVHVRPDQPLSGNAADDAKAIMRAIRAGHLYTAIDGLATPPSLEFTARNASGTAGQGDELRVDGAVTLHVRTNAPPQFTTSVWDGSTPVSTDHHEAEFTVAAPDKPAVYWVDIRPAGASAGRRRTVPWVRSNAIYVRGREPLASPAVRPSITRSRTIFDGSTIDGWTVEHDTTSVAAIDLAPMIGGSEVRFRFGLSDRITPAPFVALVYDTPAGVAPSARLTLTIRAERPMRISVQLRASPPGAPAERWQRSIYVDTADGERTVEFDDLVAMSVTSAVKPPLDSIRNIMFVVDPVNTKRGASGRIWIKRAVLQE